MRAYERSGVTVDQCTECRGIFLDRGELERLTDAEAAWQQQAGPEPRQEQPRYEKQRYEQPRYEQSRSEHGYEQQHRKPHKKKSFFDELFD
jgi:uncharacterized protein